MDANNTPTEDYSCMDWTYLVESVDLQKPWKGMSPPLPIVKSTTTVAGFYLVAWSQGIYQSPQSATTSQSLQEQSYPVLTSSTEGFHAKTLASQVFKKVWQESVVVCFFRSLGSPQKRARNGSSLKMFPISELKDLDESSKNWTSAGMTVDGMFLPLPQSERPTKDPAGFFWHTPVAEDHKKPCHREMTGGWHCLRGDVHFKYKPHPMDEAGGTLNPTWVEWLMGYKTGWTVLLPLVTQLFPPKRGKRLKDLAA